MADDLTQLDPWLSGLIARLQPGQVIRLSRKIGQALRRANAERIASNVTPDGDNMETRKRRSRADIRKDRIRKKGAMFPKIRLVRNMKVKATANHVQVNFDSKVAHTANVHHFGLRDRVARFKGAPEVRYPARPLLGFGREDEDAITQAVLDHLGD